MARTVRLTKTLVAASANNIAASQSLGAAGNLLINGSAASGGLATLDTQRRVLITSGGNDSGLTITVYGGNQSGAAISEAVTGSNGGTVATVQDFLTVSRVAFSAATASTVTVGTNTTGSTPWVMDNNHITPFEIGFGYESSGSVTAQVEYTYDEILPPLQIYGSTFTPPTPIVQPLTVNNDTFIDWPVRAWRLTVTAGTGTAILNGIQAGIRN